MSEVPVSTLKAFAAEEDQLFRSAEARLGAPFAMANEATHLLSTFIKSVSEDRDVFVRCMAIMKVHHSLALLSITRRHHVQAMMNIRQVVEAASNAAYSLAHPEAGYIDADHGLAMQPDAVSTRAYKWIANAYPHHSADLKSIKDGINDHDAHFNLVNSGRIVSADSDHGVWLTDLFDAEDLHLTHSDLWLLTLAAICPMHLLETVSKNSGGLILAADFVPRANSLSAYWVKLRDEMTSSERHQQATKLGEETDRKKAAAKLQRSQSATSTNQQLKTKET